MTAKQLAQALREAARWAEWESEIINDYHEYCQRFRFDPGRNVFELVLIDALRSRGLTLERFRAEHAK
jgi:hypothetical protein